MRVERCAKVAENLKADFTAEFPLILALCYCFGTTATLLFKKELFLNTETHYENMHFILLKKRRLNRADYAFTHGAYKKAYKLGIPLATSSDTKLAFQANRLCGLALYKQKEYKASLAFIEKSCQLGNYRHDWYNLAMASAFAGNLDKAEEAFKNTYRTNVQPGYMFSVPIPGLLFQYMKALKQMQFIDAAKKRANELKQMYAGVGEDTEKQVQRGLPSFPMFQKEIAELLAND